MTIAYISKLGLKVWKIDVKAEKINNLSLAAYKMIISIFQKINKYDKVQFF